MSAPLGDLSVSPGLGSGHMAQSVAQSRPTSSRPRKQKPRRDVLAAFEWRDPDSNRGHHDFQLLPPSGPQARNPWKPRSFGKQEQRSEVRNLQTFPEDSGNGGHVRPSLNRAVDDAPSRGRRRSRNPTDAEARRLQMESTANRPTRAVSAAWTVMPVRPRKRERPLTSENCPSRTRSRERPVRRGCAWMLKGSAPRGSGLSKSPEERRSGDEGRIRWGRKARTSEA